LFLNFLDPIGYPARDHSLVPTYAGVASTLRLSLELAARSGLSFTVDSVPGCVLGPYFLFLRATKESLRGVLYAKTTLRITDASPDTDQSQYYRVNACFDCPVSKLCPGVNFRYLSIHGPGEFRPFDARIITERKYVVPGGVDTGFEEPLGRAAEEDGSIPVELAITDRCNNRCSWCPCKARLPKEVTPAAVARALGKALSDDSVREILLTGGEPVLLHRSFFKFLKLVSGSGKRVGFVTNGRVFAYERWVKKAVSFGASFVVLRLPGPLGTLDEVTGERGAEEQTRQGLANLLGERALFVRAEVCVPDGTEGLLPGTLRQLADMGVYRMRIVPQIPLASGIEAEVRALAGELSLGLD